MALPMNNESQRCRRNGNSVDPDQTAPGGLGLGAV